MAKALGISLVICITAVGQVRAEDPAATELQSAPASNGILPSLSAFLPADSPLRLRFPDALVSDGADEVYDRRWPIGGQAALDRGITLPEPVGISVSFVDNVQLQNIGDLSVALGKGSPPPPGSDLKDLPFVELQNVESRTQSAQVRADLWVLPFLNVFGAIGSVTGDVELDVVVDVNETGLCPPGPVTCPTLRAGFTAGVSTTTVTIGATGVYGWDNWFASGTASGTFSLGENIDYAINSYTLAGRVGRRWAFGPGHIVAPYAGLSYLYLDQVVEGTTRLPDAFPDGSSLDVRYKSRVQNEDRLSGVLGLNLGFVSGYAITAEANWNESSTRSVIAATYRF